MKHLSISHRKKVINYIKRFPYEKSKEIRDKNFYSNIFYINIYQTLKYPKYLPIDLSSKNIDNLCFLGKYYSIVPLSILYRLF